jgi:general L-amino acid transport system substrate-binding protein
LIRIGIIAGLLAVALAHTAGAGNVLDRVRLGNLVRCSADDRPGVAERRPDGGIGGIAVDFCRAIAIAVLGRDGRIDFTLDTSSHAADVAFVAENDNNQSAPVIFVDRLAVLVPRPSPVRALRDLAGETVCLMVASPEQRALEAMVLDRGIDITRLAFQEDGEMQDAYAVGRCGAMIGSATGLSRMLGPLGINRLTSHLVPEPLAVMPVVAATSPADRDWAAIVHWVARSATDDAGVNPPAGVRPGWKDDARTVLKALPGR